jgi:hypothetical protein
MDKMLSDFCGDIHYVTDPSSLACNETIKVIQQQKAPIDLIEAIKMVCKGNDQIKYYIGTIFVIKYYIGTIFQEVKRVMQQDTREPKYPKD